MRKQRRWHTDTTDVTDSHGFETAGEEGVPVGEQELEAEELWVWDVFFRKMVVFFEPLPMMVSDFVMTRFSL